MKSERIRRCKRYHTPKVKQNQFELFQKTDWYKTRSKSHALEHSGARTILISKVHKTQCSKIWDRLIQPWSLLARHELVKPLNHTHVLWLGFLWGPFLLTVGWAFPAAPCQRQHISHMDKAVSLKSAGPPISNPWQGLCTAFHWGLCP